MHAYTHRNRELFSTRTDTRNPKTSNHSISDCMDMFNLWSLCCYISSFSILLTVSFQVSNEREKVGVCPADTGLNMQYTHNTVNEINCLFLIVQFFNITLWDSYADSLSIYKRLCPLTTENKWYLANYKGERRSFYMIFTFSFIS